MKKTMKYSVLRYSPSRISGEHINLGIIFCAPEDGYCDFRSIKKFARLMAFDDDLNIGNVKALLHNIKEDVKGNIFNGNRFDIDDYVEFFINDFSFEKPRQITYDDIQEVVESLYKAYFRFEYEKSERPTAEDDKKLIARLIRDSGKYVGRQQIMSGQFDDKVTYDLVTDDYRVKVFDFDNKDLSRIVNAAKTWAWNAMKNDEKRVMFIYRYDRPDKKNDVAFDTIIGILNDSGAEVCDIDTGISILQK